MAIGDGTVRPLRSGARTTRAICTTARLLGDLVAECLNAVCTHNTPPRLFSRGFHLARVVVSAEGRPTIRQVSEAALRNRLAQVAIFFRRRGKTKSDCLPPLAAVRALRACEHWPTEIPPIAGITETPVLRPDGTILDQAGYDPATGLVYVPLPTCSVPLIPTTPSAAERAAALELLDDVLADFPFADPASHANALVALLTPLLAPVIAGPIPLGLIDKPTMGTGASLLTEVIGLLATGRSAATLAAPTGRSGEEEWRKVVTSVLLEGPKVITIDNIEGELRSAALAKAISGTTWKDRVLGVSETVELPLHVSWYATGNNVRLGGDLPRRVYWTRLASLEAQPWKRDPSTFRHPDLIGYVTARRGDLIAAGLTLARAWFADGCPVERPPRMGGFQRWADVMHGILGTAGVSGFLVNQDDVFAELDLEGSAWTRFVVAWFAKFHDAPTKVKDVVKVVTDNPESDLRAALPATLVEALERERGFAQRLGTALQKRRDQVFPDGDRLLRLQKAAHDEHADVAQWIVRQVERPAAGSAGTFRTSAGPHARDREESQREQDQHQSRESPQSPHAADDLDE